MKEGPAPYTGPTAFEAARAEVMRLDSEIDALREKRTAAATRMAKYYGHTVTEAERIATAAEPHQRHPLPE